MLQLHVLIRTAKSTFITFLWMLATATNSHSHKQTSLSITHSWFCLFESAASPYSHNKTQVLILTKIILLNQIHTNMSSHTSLQACQVWIRHKSTFIYQQNKINIIQELLKKSCEKFPTLLLKHLKRMFIVGPHSQRQQWSTLRVTEALTGEGLQWLKVPANSSFWQLVAKFQNRKLPTFCFLKNNNLYNGINWSQFKFQPTWAWAYFSVWFQALLSLVIFPTALVFRTVGALLWNL